MASAVPGAAGPTGPNAGPNALADPTDAAGLAEPAGESTGELAVPEWLNGPKAVTLITGDKVTVDPAGGMTVEPAPGREHVMFPQTDGGPENLTVTPADAAQLVAEGKLDQRLFDVSYLIEHGYDDESLDELPLLFESSPVPARKAAAAAPGVEVTAAYPSLGIAAVTQSRDDEHVTELWAQLTDTKPEQAGVHTEGGDPAGWWPDGVEKVWLDAKMHVALDESVPQVGAPGAWDAGYTGEGVTVAVLDTGIDADHPDLAGQVVAAENFTTEDTIADGYGHGTHVASTIAGTGAASDGTYTGVAPNAELMNGKVCNSGGSCRDSWVMAGMEWAATNGADVINMSLGCSPSNGCSHNDGTDPLSQAVNTLTEQHDVLFVISAGNDGADRTVGRPAAADAALAVGAVDKNDDTATGSDGQPFSSRGPRSGDSAIKPEIAAPGVGIVAARSGDADPPMGTPVDDNYTSANGTSMAAPHVAGGAALIAQRHPDWSADQLKAGLMGTATALEGHSAFEVGTGRLDAHRAVTQNVHTETPSLSFGLIRWPHDLSPMTKQVTYRNDSSEPVTLDLTVSTVNEDGNPAPDGLFSIDAAQLTVPAGGTASTTVTVAPEQAGVGTSGGTFSGGITATDADGDIAVQTAIGVDLEPESYDLTVNLLDRNGQPPTAQVEYTNFTVFDHADGRAYNNGAKYKSGDTLRLPAGDYGIVAYISTPRPDRPDQVFGRFHDYSVMAYPELNLSEDTTLTLDARQTRKVEVTVDRSTAKPYYMETTMAFKVDPTLGSYYSYFEPIAWPTGILFDDVYVGSFGQPSDKFFHAVTAQLTEPLIRLDVNGGGGFPVDVWYADSVIQPGTPLRGAHRMGVVHGGAGTPADLDAVDATGKLVVLDIRDLLPFRTAELRERVENVKDAGGRAVLLDHAPESIFRNVFEADAPALPTLLAADPQRTRLVELAQQGGASVTTHGVTTSPYQYNLLLPTDGQVPQRPVYHPENKELGVVEADYRFTGAVQQTNYRDAWYRERSLSTRQGIPSIAEPKQRTEYYSAGIPWNRYTGGRSWQMGPTFVTERQEYAPGRPQRITELAAVMGPSFPHHDFSPPCCPSSGRAGLVFREGNTMDIQVPMLSDGRYTTSSVAGYGQRGYTRLYRNGELVGQNTAPAVGVATELPGEEATYRIEAQALPGSFVTTLPSWAESPRWEVSTNVEAAWTFTSAETDQPTMLPLMAVRFEPTLDEYNRAPAGRRFQIPVSVHHQPGSTNAAVTDLSIEASFDGGETWTDARFLGKMREGEARIMLVHPPLHRTDSCVTLRATAEDADGNTVEQTIECAYQLKAAGQVASFASIGEQLDTYAADNRITRAGEARMSAKLRQAKNYQRRGATDRAIDALEEIITVADDDKYVPDGVLQADLIGAAEELVRELDAGSSTGGGNSNGKSDGRVPD